MEFEHLVITENTKENREWLINLGYTPLEFFLYKKFIYTNATTRANSKRGEWKEFNFETHDEIKETINGKKYINCVGNNKLFKAISAIRNDSDINQWFIADANFTDEKEWIFCDRENIKELEIYTTFTKATLEDILFNFKK